MQSAMLQELTMQGFLHDPTSDVTADTPHLVDLNRKGQPRPWEVHKVANELLSLAYDDVDARKAERLRSCSPRLTFAVDADGHHLRQAAFCRVRLCPVCTWRRSLKVGAQMHKILAEIERQELPMRYIMLTLTVRNPSGRMLSSTITKMLKAYSNMTKRVDFGRAVVGWYRALEITHDLDNDTYHPHIHCILAVDPSYFTGADYIKQERWVKLWQHALGVAYEPSVDVRVVSDDMPGAVAEVAKYTVKSDDFIVPDDWDMTVDTVKVLDKALHNRRFVAFGGLFKLLHRQLNLDDADAGDLVHVEDDVPTAEVEHYVSYAWFSGYRQYKQII